MAVANIEITCSALGDAFADSATVTEEISKPIRAEVAVETKQAVAADDLIGQDAVVSWGDRHFALVVTEVENPDLDGGATRYNLILEHRMALLRYRRDHRTFLEKSVKDIVFEVIKAAGLTSPTWSASRGGAPRTACVQYGETDYDFVQRLCADEGVFWFAPDDASEAKITFADAASAFEDIPGKAEIGFEGENVDGGIIDISFEHVVTAGAVSLIDYDFEKPGVDLTSRYTIDDSPAGEHFEYPGGFTTQADGAAYAKIRAEEIASTKVRVTGIASRHAMAAAKKFELSSQYEGAPSGKFLLRRVEHSFGARYRNRFIASPFDLPYRPLREVPRPNLGGAQVATITAPQGSPEQTIHTDKYGRFKALYAWDRLGKSDDTSSQWIRLTQPMVGGSMMLARLGWEIALRHVDGDPDRPVGVARMFDGTHPPPETLAANKTKTSLGTLTSTGAAKINSIVIDDKAGSMMMTVTAAKDLDATVLHDETESIGANDTLAVGQDNTVLIGDKQVTTIEKDETMTAKKDAGVAVAGDRTKKITKDETATVDGGVSVRVDGNDEESVGQDLKITADEGFLETAKGKYDLTVTGAVTAKAKKDYTIWIGGKSSETVGAAKTVKSDDGAITEAVKGDVNLTVGGAWTENADGNRTSSAQGEMERTVGAAGTLTATGKLQIKAKKIKITVGGAATFVGGGGTLSVSPASVAFVGLVTLKGSGGVEIAGVPQMAG
jgi:type VI secretion system secreted protein VgrG